MLLSRSPLRHDAPKACLRLHRLEALTQDPRPSALQLSSLAASLFFFLCAKQKVPKLCITVGGHDERFACQAPSPSLAELVKATTEMRIPNYWPSNAHAHGRVVISGAGMADLKDPAIITSLTRQRPPRVPPAWCWPFECTHFRRTTSVSCQHRFYLAYNDGAQALMCVVKHGP